MSEREPITAELRDLILRSPHEQFDCFPPVTRVSMDEHKVLTLCDNVDAIHANLERENESLKVELDRVLGEQEPRHIGSATVTITPTLDWTGVARELRAIAGTLAGDDAE